MWCNTRDTINSVSRNWKKIGVTLQSFILSESSISGIGVFANKVFTPYEQVDALPILFIPKKEIELINQTVVGKFYYDWDEENFALPLGFLSFVNHSYNPNLLWIPDTDKMVFLAYRRCSIGEELTINYNGQPNDCAKLVNFKVK